MPSFFNILPPPYTARCGDSPPPPDYSYLNNPKRRNRSLSLRTSKTHKSTASSEPSSAGGTKHKFGFASLRGSVQPELSKRLYRLIKSENYVIESHTTAGRERISTASQLSDWGLATGDDGVSDISDKMGVLLSELGEMEIVYAQNLEDYRSTLKRIRNTEASVQPSRDNKAKITDEIQKLKYKDPQNTKIMQLEQELVRAEAENLVAEAQLTNITRQKLKEAFAANMASVIERSEKQAIIAKHGRRILNLLDDTPVIPGDVRPILADCEEDLRNWRLEIEEVSTNANLDNSAMPAGESPIQSSHHNAPHRVASSSSTGSSEHVHGSGQQTVLHGKDAAAPIPVENEKNVDVPQAVPAS